MTAKLMPKRSTAKLMPKRSIRQRMALVLAMLMVLSTLSPLDSKAMDVVTEATIDFETNGGTEIEPVTATIGSQLGEGLPQSVKEGYTLSWFLDDALTREAVPTTRVEGDMTLYAKWDAITYIIDYDLNGKSGYIPPATVKYGEEFTLPKVLNSGFSGWSNSADGEYLYPKKIKNLANEQGKHITVYAVWDTREYDDPISSTYKVSFPALLELKESAEHTYSTDYNISINGSIEAHEYVRVEPINSAIDMTNQTGDKSSARVEQQILSVTGIKNDTPSIIRGKVIMEDTPADDYTGSLGIKFSLEGEPTIYFNGNGATDGEMASIAIDRRTSIKLPPVGFTKDHYLFKGWSTTPTGSVTYTDEGLIKTTVSKTLYAVWQGEDVTITYDANTGEGDMPARTVHYDDEFNLDKNTFTKDRHVFAGWSTTPEGTASFTDKEKVTAKTNITLYAVWHKDVFKVDYDTNGGSGSIPSVYVDEFDSTTLPEYTGTKEGYTFTGWSTDKLDPTAPVNGKAPGEEVTPTDDELYYAVWQKDMEITYNANSGEGDMPMQYVTYDKATPLTKNTFTKEGYHFIGWSTSTDGDVEYADEADITPKTDVELYAVWEINEYNLTFVPNGGQGEMPQQAFKHGVPQALNDVAFTRQYYTFKGWSTSASGEVKFTDKAEVTLTSNSTLYAIWERIIYTVSFDSNGGHVDLLPAKVKAGESYELPMYGGTRTGYTFKGWGNSKTTTEYLTAGTSITPESDMTVYAVWTINSYDIVFNANTGDGTMPNQALNYKETATLSKNLFEKTGYTFKGWTPNGGVVAAGSIGERLFVAVWELDVGEKSYTIIFNANGGNCESSERSVLKGGEYGELPVPTRTGYDFDGWFTAAEGGSCVSDKTVADKNATLFAHWNPKNYTITYVLGGGRNAAENPATYTIEDAVVLLVPVRDGYLFTGWTPDGGRIAKGSIGERTFTATWKAPEPGTPIVVTFDANGGSVTETSRTVKSGAAVGELPTPVRSGYTFAGWWTAASGGERISESTIVISNVTFYAHWTTGVSFLGVATWKFYEEADDDEGLNLAAWEEWSAADVPFWIGEGINMAIPVDGSFTADDVALVAGSYSDYGRPQVVSDEWMFAKHYTSLKTAIGYDPYEDGEYDQGAYGLVFEDDVRGRNYSLSMDIWPQKKVLSGRKWILLEMGGNPTKGCKTFYLGVKGRDDVGYSRFRIYATPDQGVSQRPSDWSSQRELAVLPMPIGGGTTTGSGMYVNGTRVSLSATPVAGYEFEGWYDQSSGQQLGTSTSLTYVMGDANSVIIAKFTLATECFMTFDANGGTPKTQSVKQRSEELFVLPAEPKLADHLFMGWWTEKNGGVKVTDETVFLTGVYETLYAHWTKKRAVSAQICEDAFSGFGTVELDDDDNIVVTLTSDVNGTVEIPDDVGRVLIDLNGHSIIGADGSAAIRVVSGNGDGEITRLSIGDTSDGDKGIIAGDGESVAIDIADDAAPSVHLDVYDDVAVLNGDGTEQQWRELFPVELSIQVGEYFKATLAGLGYNVPTDGKTPYTVKALGLPAGLKLVGNKAVKDKKGKITKKANVEWWIEGVPTAPLDFMTNPPYLVITVNGETRTETLPVDVKAQEVVDLGELELGQSINTNGWLAGVGAGWTVSGLPTGLKYATKKVTKTTGSGKKKVTTTVAEAYAVYGKTTKAGLFTITAKQKVGGYYETLKYRVLVKPAPVDTALFGEELANITTMAYVPFEWDLTNDVAAVGGNVSKVAGLPNGVTFAAATTYKDKKKTQVKQYGQTIVGTPTKPGTYVVTFTKNVKSGKTTVAKTAQILWTVVENDAELELAFNIAGGVIEGGSAGLKYGDLMAFTATDGAAVTASGMPAGIALANLGDGNYAFTGFTEKAGTYLVAVTATLNGKTVTQRMALEVDGLPSWAKGTFNGYIAGVDGATNGLATITVSSVGKISGKFQEGGTNWTFTAASYIGYDSAAPAYSVPVVAKYSYKEKEKVKGNGKWTTKTIAKYVARDFTLRVGQDALGGVATLEEVGGGSTVHAWQNLWGQADYKALGKQLFSTKSGKKTLAYRTFTIKGTDDVGAEMGLADAMSLSLKVTTAGAVTVTMSFDTGKTSKGKAVIYKPTCSTVVIPLSAADAEEFEGEAILFFAPSSANGFPGFAGAAPF